MTTNALDKMDKDGRDSDVRLLLNASFLNSVAHNIPVNDQLISAFDPGVGLHHHIGNL